MSSVSFFLCRCRCCTFNKKNWARKEGKHLNERKKWDGEDDKRNFLNRADMKLVTFAKRSVTIWDITATTIQPCSSFSSNDKWIVLAALLIFQGFLWIDAAKFTIKNFFFDLMPFSTFTAIASLSSHFYLFFLRNSQNNFSS